MSTVLWANLLIDGTVNSENADRYALYRHLDRLDGICRAIGVTPLSEMCDSTDAQVNMGKLELPAGMKSTYELMAKNGVWVLAGDALQTLEKLKAEIQQRQTRFGLLRNDHQAVVEELLETITYLKRLDGKEARFNFAIVM